MRPIVHILFIVGTCVAFALTMLLLMVLFLPAQDVRDGAWIFALAFTAVFALIAISARANRRHIEDFARRPNWHSLRAMLWRSRKNRR